MPGWDNQKARTIFEQMLVKTGNKIDARRGGQRRSRERGRVALKAKKLKPIPLSGQDATAQGVQNIISGWQTMTVWKDTRMLATASAAAAVALLKGQTPKRTGTVQERQQEAAGVHHPAGLDHEGELQAAVQRLPEAERGLPRGVQEVLQVAT